MASLLRNDGNLVSILGSATANVGQRGQGPNKYHLQQPDLLSREELNILYRWNWLARRVVDLFPDDCTKKWLKPFTFGTEEETELPDDMAAYLDRLHAREMFAERDRWARLFPGGAFIFIGANDGQPLDEPLDENRISTIEHLEVFDSYELLPAPTENRFKPEFFNYYPAHLAIGRNRENLPSGTRIHESRIITQLGKKTTKWDYFSDRVLPSDSELTCIYKALVQYDTSSESANGMLGDHDVLIHRINGLANLIATGKSDNLQKHMQEVLTTLSMFNIWMQDGENESSERLGHSFSGVSDTVGLARDEVTASTGIPHYKIWGSVGKAGLSDSGGAERRAWASQVNGYQNKKYRPGLERLCELIFKADDGPTNGEVPEVWHFEFESIYEPTPEEEASLKSTYAATDKTNIDAGIYDPEDARQRYEGTVFKTDLILEPLEEQPESVDGLPPGFGLPPNVVQPPEQPEDVLPPDEPPRQDSVVPVLGIGKVGDRRMVAILQAYKEDRECSKGYSCGSSCITRSKACLKSLTAEQVKLVNNLKGMARVALSQQLAQENLAQKEASGAIPVGENVEPEFKPLASNQDISDRTNQWAEERGFRGPDRNYDRVVHGHDMIHTLAKDMIGETSEQIAEVGRGPGNLGPDHLEEALVKMTIDMAGGMGVREAAEQAHFYVGMAGALEENAPYYAATNKPEHMRRMIAWGDRIMRHPDRQAYFDRTLEYLGGRLGVELPA